MTYHVTIEIREEMAERVCGYSNQKEDERWTRHMSRT